METFGKINGYNNYYKSAYSVLKLFIDKKNIEKNDLDMIFSENNLTYQDYAAFNFMKKEGLINFNPIKDSYFILDDILNMSDDELNNLCFGVANRMLARTRANQDSIQNKFSFNGVNDVIAKTLVIGGIIVGSLLFVIGFFVYYFAPSTSNMFSAAIVMVVGACLTGICLLISGVLEGEYVVYIILFLLFLSEICVSLTLFAVPNI